ncbi:MAG: DUF4160 domain-containing protein [Planctomycetota bacterium]|jgi:hypothetical protein
MTRIRRGGYLFLTWKGDHPPRHVHVFRGGRLIVRWNLETGVPLGGMPPRRVVKLIHALVAEGKL